MRYEITLAPEAAEDLRCLKANVHAQVHDTIERHLRHEPTKTSKARIKRLRGVQSLWGIDYAAVFVVLDLFSR